MRHGFTIILFLLYTKSMNTLCLSFLACCMQRSLVSMLHPEPAWIDPSGVLKFIYTSSTYAIIFFCQIYEIAGFNRQNIVSRGLEVYFCFLMAMSHIGLHTCRSNCVADGTSNFTNFQVTLLCYNSNLLRQLLPLTYIIKYLNNTPTM